MSVVLPNGTLTHEQMQAIATVTRGIEGAVRELHELFAEPAPRDGWAVIEGSAKRRTKPRGKLTAVKS